MFWLHSGSKDGFERKQGDFLVESKNIRRSHSARAYCILSYFHTFNILKTSRIAVQLEVFTYYHISSAINMCLDISPTIVIFSGGEKDKRHVVTNRCIPSIPGVLYPHHPMHRNQTCILLQGKNAESYPPGEKSIHEGKMQKSIHLVYRIAKT